MDESGNPVGGPLLRTMRPGSGPGRRTQEAPPAPRSLPSRIRRRPSHPGGAPGFSPGPRSSGAPPCRCRPAPWSRPWRRLRARSRPSQAPVAHPPVYLSMDFTDVELPVLIKFMKRADEENFIFDERVQGKITIISPARVTMRRRTTSSSPCCRRRGSPPSRRGTRSRSSPPGKRARTRSDRRLEGKPLGGVHHPPRSSAEPRERRGRPADHAAVSKDGMVSAFVPPTRCC